MKRPYVICPVCHKPVRLSRLAAHSRRMHKGQIPATTVAALSSSTRPSPDPGRAWVRLKKRQKKQVAKTLKKLSDAEILERLTAARGVGRWTVEMYLIFTLGRPDILPVDDLGVRKGAEKLYRRKFTPKQLDEYGARWSPHRSAAAWHFWRIADTMTPERAPVKKSKAKVAKKAAAKPKAKSKAKQKAKAKARGPAEMK